MMTKTAVPLMLVAIGLCSVAVAQPPPPPPKPPPPPPPAMSVFAAPPVETGLLAAAESRIGALGLMTVMRELTKDEQAQIQDAHQVAELLGAGGRNFLGPISKLARERGIFQESIRALQRGQYQQAALGLAHCLVLFPNAKILYRELGEVFLKLDDAPAAAGFWAGAIGVSPPEDETFVSLIKMSLLNWEFEDAKIPEKAPALLQSQPSIATLSRACAALSLSENDKLAAEALAKIQKRLEGDNKYPELAAAAAVELSLAAAQALLEGEDFPGRAEAVERLHLSAIAACDGALVSGFLNRPGSARWVPLRDDGEQVGKLMDMAHAIAYYSAPFPVRTLSAEVREAAEKMTDFPVLQALLAHPGK